MAAEGFGRRLGGSDESGPSYRFSSPHRSERRLWLAARGQGYTRLEEEVRRNRMRDEAARVAGDGFFWRVRRLSREAGDTSRALVVTWDESASMCQTVADLMRGAPEDVRRNVARTIARHVLEGVVVMYARALESYVLPIVEDAWRSCCEGVGEVGSTELMRTGRGFHETVSPVFAEVRSWSGVWGVAGLSGHHAVDVALFLVEREPNLAHIPMDVHVLKLALSQLGREGFAWFDEGFRVAERACAKVVSEANGMRECARVCSLMSQAVRAGWDGGRILSELGDRAGSLMRGSILGDVTEGDMSSLSRATATPVTREEPARQPEAKPPRRKVRTPPDLTSKLPPGMARTGAARPATKPVTKPASPASTTPTAVATAPSAPSAAPPGRRLPGRLPRLRRA